MRGVLLVVMMFWCVAALAEEDYFPLAVGQTRVMTTTRITNEGTSTASDTRERITGITEMNGKSYFRCFEGRASLHLQLHLIPATLFRKEGTAVYWMREGVRDPVEKLYIILPLREGATWKRFLADMPWTVTVIGLEAMEINGTSYPRCYHLRATNADGAMDSWYAPNIGEIKSEYVVAKNGFRVIQLLKEFKRGE